MKNEEKRAKFDRKKFLWLQDYRSVDHVRVVSNGRILVDPRQGVEEADLEVNYAEVRSFSLHTDHWISSRLRNKEEDYDALNKRVVPDLFLKSPFFQPFELPVRHIRRVKPVQNMNDLLSGLLNSAFPAGRWECERLSRDLRLRATRSLVLNLFHSTFLCVYYFTTTVKSGR